MNTMRRPPSSRAHVCSTSDSGTGRVAILKPPGAAACSTAPMAATKRSGDTLPMPLPKSSIAEERSAALGSIMFGPLTEPI